LFEEIAMRVRLAALALVCMLLAASAGCGTSSGAFTGATVPVKGTVTYKGKALTQGEVVFEPESGGREAHGTIQPDGSFELTTYGPGDGAVIGTHRVAVTGTARKVNVPARYRNVSASKVEVEVSEGRADYAIDLK
jgi:hypothetical protein